MRDESWAAWIERTMEARNLTQAAFCRAVGVNDSVVNRWRSGTQPTVPHLRKVAAATGAPLLDLLVVAGYITAKEARMPKPPAMPETPPDPIETVVAKVDPESRDTIRRMLHAAIDTRKIG